MTAAASGHERPGPARDAGSGPSASDEDLLRAIAGGDARAFRLLLDSHLDAIHAYLYRMTGSRADAEDLAQETFLRVWRRASTFAPGRVQVTTWIHTIAHNLCIDTFRRNRFTNEADADPLLDATSDPERQVSGSELVALAEQAIAALPDNQRSALLLCQVQGFSNAQAARILGVKVRALESLLARARRALREALSTGSGDEAG